MRVFVAGSTGAVGKFLVPHLIENGHEVVTLVRAVQKAKTLELMGAKVALAESDAARGTCRPPQCYPRQMRSTRRS